MEDQPFCQQSAQNPILEGRNEPNIQSVNVDRSPLMKSLPATPVAQASTTSRHDRNEGRPLASGAVMDGSGQHAHVEDGNDNNRKPLLQNEEKPEILSSPFKRVLHNLNPKKKKGKAKQANYRNAVQTTHGRSGGGSAQFPPIASSSQPFMPQIVNNFDSTHFQTQLQNPYQFQPNTNVQNFHSPYNSFSFFNGGLPQPVYHQPTQLEDFKVTLGGQLINPVTNRLPSTFLTPTNTNTYAIAGRSRVVSGRPIESHHAAIYDTTSQSNQPALSHIFTDTPVVRFALDEDDNTSEQSDHTKTNKEFIPGVPFSMEHLDAKLVHSGHRNATKERATQEKTELRRSASVPAGLMMRGSAVPPPLALKKKQVEAESTKEAAANTAPTGQAHGRIKEEYLIAAFDGVHRHLEDVKGELMARMDRVEEKMDHVLALFSASAAAVQQRKKQQQQQQRQQQREIRPNLTGPPPHIPFGGMEGWYHAVKK